MFSPTVKRRIKKVLLWTEILFILVLGAGMGVVLGAFYQMNKLLPPDAVLDLYRPPVGTKIYSADNVLLASIASENREMIPLERVPKVMQEAIIAIEDSRFYEHSGLDYRGLVRALVNDVSGHELGQGASTITQQLARNMFLSNQKTFSRKIKEALLACQIERNWTKRRILQAYLNQVYFGSGAYGIQAASKVYFGKSVEKVTLPEAAMLAGLVQRPSSFSPYEALKQEGTTKRTKARRDAVLQRMADVGFIPQAKADKAKHVPIHVMKERPHTSGFLRAKYFVQYVMDQLRDKLNYPQEILEKSGLTVITTLNWKMQQVADEVAREEVNRLRRSNRVSEAALVCLDPHTGYIRAMVGGVNPPWEKHQFNCATQAHRQPGSSFKLFVYTTAFENGASPYSYVNSEASIPMPDGTYYTPHNHGRYRGGMDYEEAFAQSVNGAAVNVAVKTGLRKVVDMAHRFGLPEKMYAYPSIALGVCDVTPLEMASAYGSFAAHGKRATPQAILQVRNQDKEVLYDAQPDLTDLHLRQETLEDINELTRAVVTHGTGVAASVVPDAHGKTGTTEDFTNAWFCGYTPDLATAVWCGNRDNSPMAHTFGATVAVPIWTRFMQQAVQLNPNRNKNPALAKAAARAKPKPRRARPRPISVPLTADASDRNRIRVNVCTESGMLATPYCPHTEMKDFLLGEQPLSQCNIHTAATAAAAEKKKARASASEKKPPPADAIVPNPPPPAHDQDNQDDSGGQ